MHKIGLSALMVYYHGYVDLTPASDLDLHY